MTNMTHIQFRRTKAPMNCWPFANVFHLSNVSTTLPVYIAMCGSLSSNGHEKTKETSKFKKLWISKRGIGILKKVTKQGEESLWFYEIPVLTLKIIIWGLSC